MKAFIIDDEKVVNFITKRLLGHISADIEIVEFTESKLAMESIVQANPSIIFLDLNMPRINGWEFLEAMEAQGLPHKVVILSSSVSTIDQQRAKKYKNVISFIEKPAKREDLRQCLEAGGFLP